MNRIAILLDDGDRAVASLRAAGAVRVALGARLVVYRRRGGAGLVSDGGPIVAVDVGYRRIDRDAGCRAAFDAAFGGSAESCEFASVPPGCLGDFMERIAPAFDALLLERISEEEGPEVEALNAALFHYGGPVLIVPPAPAETPRIGRHLAIAWSGTPQAMRAVRAARPLLRPGTAVTVLSPAGAEPDRAGLAAYLEAAGLAPVWLSFGEAAMSARQRGRTLVAAAIDSGADLLIVGAFGANAMGRLFGLGGATQKVVSACRLPVLLHA